MNAVIVLPMRLRSGPNTRLHWRQRARTTKAERSAAWANTVGWRLADKEVAVVTLTRLAPRKMDDDNLQGVLKAVRDGVADRLGVRDDDPQVQWRYGQESAGTRFYGVRIALDTGEEGQWTHT